MASRKKIDGWFADLRMGTAKKREAAAKRLASVDRAGARDVLLELVGTEAAARALPAATRRVLRRCLRYVADLPIARQLVAAGDVVLDPAYLPASLLAALYEDLRRELSSLDAREVVRRIRLLAVFQRAWACGENDDEDAWCQARAALAIGVLRDERVAEVHADAVRAARWFDGAIAVETARAVLAAWDARRAVTVIDAAAAWARVPDAPPRPDLLHQLVEGLPSLQDIEGDAVERARLDQALVLLGPRVPPEHALPLLVALSPGVMLPLTTAEVARKVVALAVSTPELVALLDDARVTPCHSLAADALVMRGGLDGVRAALDRPTQVPLAVLSKALAELPPEEAHAFLASRITAHTSTHHWYDALVAAPSVLRDARCLELVTRIALPNRGRALLEAVARDTTNPGRPAALPMIEAARQSAAEAAEARLQKRYALHAIGQTKSPQATTLLIEALDDPDIGDIAPMVCTLLGEVADSRAIPALEERRHGRHAAFVAAAIEAVRERMARERAAAFAAARNDADPIIADLAKSAADGDAEAAAVLEDALRERGRLER